MAIPAMIIERGTPASMRERTPPHTVAMDEDPLDSRMSETMRIVYGKTSSSVGIERRIDFSARAP